jgi:hypothetical protein
MDNTNKGLRRSALVMRKAMPAAVEGMLLATQSGRFNGWGLYLLQGKPVCHERGGNSVSIRDSRRWHWA